MPTSKILKYIQPGAVYKALYEYYGPQGWWPVTRGGGFTPRYHKSEYAGKSAKEKFEICAGALLTQNTAWKNAEKALYNLNREGAFSPRKLAELSRARLALLIRPSGYFNQKAERLQYFAGYILKHYAGKIERLLAKPKDELREELLSLKGIGPETADSMVLYAAEKPSFVIDAYTLRVGMRLGWFKEDTAYEAARHYISSKLPLSLKVYNEFHALIAAVCKDFCEKNPDCGDCVLKEHCVYEKKR